MFNELLEVLAERFDQVIIDSPPVMGTADSRIIAASCDVTVLILRAEKSTRRISEMARDALNSVGANLLGIIINQMDSSDVVHLRLLQPKTPQIAQRCIWLSPPTDCPCNTDYKPPKRPAHVHAAPVPR